jgi:hypothetical protein
VGVGGGGVVCVGGGGTSLKLPRTCGRTRRFSRRKIQTYNGLRKPLHVCLPVFLSSALSRARALFQALFLHSEFFTLRGN